MFGMNGQNLGDIEADIAMDDAVASIGEAMAGAQGMGLGGPVGPSNQSSDNLGYDISSNLTNPAGGTQTANFNTQTLTGAMKSVANWAGNLLSNFSPMQNAMQWGMSMMPQDMRAPMYGVMDLPGYQGLVENLGQDPNLAQAYGATTGVPYGFDEAMQNVPVVGSGAHLGLATNIANIGGQNVHMGPGFMMNENNYPGYGVNPVTGEGFADPGDPYIRKRRGTEIAGMVGP